MKLGHAKEGVRVLSSRLAKGLWSCPGALLFAAACGLTAVAASQATGYGVPASAPAAVAAADTTPRPFYGAELAPYQRRTTVDTLISRAQASIAKSIGPKSAENEIATAWNSKPAEATSGGLTTVVKVPTSNGGVKPGEVFPVVIEYSTGDAPVAAASYKVTLHPAAMFNKATPAAASGDGKATPLSFTLAAIPAKSKGKIVVEARAKTLAEDPEVMWKTVFTEVSMEVTGQPAVALRSHGPKVSELKSLRMGDRPFPVVMVQYQDIKHCTGKNLRGGLPTDPNDESCTQAHTAATLDAAINSRTSGKSLYQLYQDMSFGQIFPQGSVNPKAGTPDTNFDSTYNHKFTVLAPDGACASGVTLVAPGGTKLPVYTKRIENGWYTLPGNQAYYGSDKGGPEGVKGQVGAPNMGIDDACGPIAKVVYDAASIADPDIDYNDFDTDKDGVVDFFNIMFAGEGGNGNLGTTGINNIWPHKSDLRGYYPGVNGQSGYVSNDQLKNHFDEPLFWKDDSYREMTTSPASGLKVFVRIGLYNVNPENSNEFVSVVGHEYGHSLGLPDYYSTSARDTYGTWNLMATDYFHFYPAYDRARMGWIVPKPLVSGEATLRESKSDTSSINWVRPDGTPYTLTGEGIRNGDTYKVNLPTALLIDKVPSGSHAWFSGAGNDFGCPGHYLDVYLPGMQQTGSAAAIALKFKSLYEIEWDFDYGFVLVSTDGGKTFTSLASKKGTTIASTYNPNTNGCLTQYNNGITGVSGDGTNTQTNPHRQAAYAEVANPYPAAAFIDDEYDLTAFKGKPIIVRFAYSTDSGLAKRGWFIDDLSVTADGNPVYVSDFEKDHEPDTLYPRNWQRASTSDGVDTEHAYYIELRDRLNNDFDSKAQSERGAPTWEPGVSMIITDENHGYGNTGVDDPPAQSPVDAKPEPGDITPNLDDAAFTLERPTFDGCTHVDNYTDAAGPDGKWKLPKNLKFTVTSLTGLSGLATKGAPQTTPAVAKLLAEVNPDCDLKLLPPELSIGSGYENPDSDGSYVLAWTRPAGAVGPDTLQEATNFATLLEDDAEGGLAKWVATTQGSSASVAWRASMVKKHGGSNAFYANIPDEQTSSTDPAVLLTLKDPIQIPPGSETTLTYWDFFGGELDDSVATEITVDNGTTWKVLKETVRPLFADEAVTAQASEALSRQVISLNDYSGKTVKLRFRLQSGGSDYTFYQPLGWYIDDIKVETSNFRDYVVKTPEKAANIKGHGSGTYYYRVKTAYPASTVTVPSGYSNIVTIKVKDGVVAQPETPSNPPTTPNNPAPTPVPVQGNPATTVAPEAGRFGGAPAPLLLMLLATAAALRRRRTR